MDRPSNRPVDGGGEWDGSVGWFSLGHMIDSTGALPTASADDNTQPISFPHALEALSSHIFPAPATVSCDSVEGLNDMSWIFAMEAPALTSMPSPALAYSQYEPDSTISPVENPHTTSAQVSHGQAEWLVQQDDQVPSVDGVIRISSSDNDISAHALEHRARRQDDAIFFGGPSLRIDPPLSDHLHIDAPRRQGPRFAGDEYAATWIRGDGIEREGWCGICSSWHRLKDSGFWYHMHYTHGISCQTGKPFRHPLKMRPVKKSLGYEVLCGVCNRWLQVSSAERWRTPYFRHAYRCHAQLIKSEKPINTSARRSPSKKKRTS